MKFKDLLLKIIADLHFSHSTWVAVCGLEKLQRSPTYSEIYLGFDIT